MYLDRVVRTLLDRGIAHDFQLRGCTETQIQELEQHFGLMLPSSYQEFLRVMGSGMGYFFQGTDFNYECLLDLRPFALEILEERKVNFVLPDDSFVFAMHQGYDFFFFIVSEGDDPPVYEFWEGIDRPKRLAEHFSEWLEVVAEKWPKPSA